MQTFREIVGEPDLDDPEGNKPASIKKRYRRELQKAERENRENTSALLELRDMEDELTTLYRLFETQEVTIRSMKAIYMGVELNAVTQNGQAYLDQALSRLDEYKQQTTEMLKRVDTTRKDVSPSSISTSMSRLLRHPADHTFSSAVRETPGDGTAPSTGARHALVPDPDGARVEPEPRGHDLHHLYRHLPALELLHGPLRHEHGGVGGAATDPRLHRRHLAPALLLPHRVVTDRRLQLARAGVVPGRIPSR